MSGSKELQRSQAEDAMLESFEQQVKEILDNSTRYENRNGWKIGLETEYPIVDMSLNPVTHETRDEMIEGLDFADVEVGGSQVEVRTDPMTPDSLSELEQAMRSIESELSESASVYQVELLRAGTNPFVDLENIPVSEQDKYQKVPAFHDRERHSEVHPRFGRDEFVDPRDADLAALINSTQTNIEADSLEDAVVKANLTYMISPFMSAISSNARFLDSKDLGFADIRMPLWEKSHDTRNPENLSDEHIPAGKLDSYYSGIRDYFQRVGDQPFILNGEEKRDAALDIGIGTFWKDSRIKFNTEPENERYEAVVESRVVSTQPSIEEEIAMHGFYVGRLAYAQNRGEIEGDETGTEELLDIRKVNRNRYAAMHNGLDTKLYGTDGELEQADKVLGQQLDKAMKGLEYAGIDDEGYMEILYDRLENGVPSELMAEGFNNALEQGKNRKQAIKKGIQYQGNKV